MKQTYLIMILFVAAVMSVMGCKKKSNTKPVTPPPPVSSYDFTYSGNMYTFSMVSFKSAAPAGSTYLWKFGDGATSTDSMPSHAYSSPDSFVATLTVNNDSAHATYHGFKINSTVQKMGGNYVNTKEGGIVQNNMWPINFSIFYSIDPSDYTFSITVLNESSISLKVSNSGTLLSTKTFYASDSLGTGTTATFIQITNSEFVTYDFTHNHIYYDDAVLDLSSGKYDIDAFQLQ